MQRIQEKIQNNFTF